MCSAHVIGQCLTIAIIEVKKDRMIRTQQQIRNWQSLFQDLPGTSSNSDASDVPKETTMTEHPGDINPLDHIIVICLRNRIRHIYDPNFTVSHHVIVTSKVLSQESNHAQGVWGNVAWDIWGATVNGIKQDEQSTEIIESRRQSIGFLDLVLTVDLHLEVRAGMGELIRRYSDSGLHGAVLRDTVGGLLSRVGANQFMFWWSWSTASPGEFADGVDNSLEVGWNGPGCAVGGI